MQYQRYTTRTVENAMITFCLKNQIDLVLNYEKNAVNSQSGWRKIALDRVASKLNFPILNVSFTEYDSDFKTIVLPIKSTLPLISPFRRSGPIWVKWLNPKFSFPQPDISVMTS